MWGGSQGPCDCPLPHQHFVCFRAARPPPPTPPIALRPPPPRVCNFAIGQLFLGAVASFGVPTVYLFFAAVCFGCVAYVGRSVVETKGRSVAEIERLMAAA